MKEKKNPALLKVSPMQKIFFWGEKGKLFTSKCILLISLLSFDHSVFEIKSIDFIQLLYVEMFSFAR